MYLYVVQQVIESIYNAIPVARVANNYLSWLKVFDIIQRCFKCKEICTVCFTIYKTLVIGVVSQASGTKMHGKPVSLPQHMADSSSVHLTTYVLVL